MVFQDPTGARWKYARAVFLVIGAICLLLLLACAVAVLVPPRLPQLGRSAFDGGATDAAARPADAGPTTLPAGVDALGKLTTRPAAPLSTPRGLLGKPFVRTAFFVQDDPRSVVDLRAHLEQLDVVFPDWYSCPSPTGKLTTHIEPETLQILSGSSIQVFPRLANVDDRGTWHGDDFSEVLNDDDAAHRLTRELVAELTRAGAQGVCLDLEEIADTDRDAYLDWLEELAGELHSRKLGLVVAVPLNEEAFDYEVIGKLADAVVVMGYDEHYPTGSPGPIASEDWFYDGVTDIVERIPREKLIFAVGAYGYDWKVSSKEPARSLGFVDAMKTAGDAGAHIEMDGGNSHFEYSDSGGAKHAVWFLDAVSAWNELMAIRKSQLAGVSLWRLGQEEPAFWKVLSRDEAAASPSEILASVSSDDSVALEGEGELYRVTQVAREGRRQIELDPGTFDGRAIAWSSYSELPQPYIVQRSGHTNAKRVALTFDDGPDAKWTPQVLNALAQEGVPATFFVVGQQASAFPELIKRESEAGHLLGSHTYYHSNIQNISASRLRAELNATQRVIEAVTGRQTLLFRAPYDTDASPSSPEQLAPLYTTEQMGYVAVGADVDSEDYERPGAERIVRNVLDGLHNSKSNIVVFHDAGGDRRQTVEAVAMLIPQLKAEGYEFVTIDQLLGVAREAVMPAPVGKERAVVAGARILGWLRSTGSSILWTVFLIAAALPIIRIAFLSVFVYRSRKAQTKDAARDGIRSFTPNVRVLIPAYNEAKVIGRTLEAVLRSDYPNFNVLVIDDGSTDRTAEMVAAFASRDDRVNLMQLGNGGKARALNRGFLTSAEEYVVTIDADTLVEPQTIRELIQPFSDDSIDAVCGNVQVGNARNLLTHFQDVEYVTSQNYDRRAFDALNCISVVPGATGAWRREAVLNVGGYSQDTLTEDADLTLSVLRCGGRIVYAPKAKSITEAPESHRALMKQRFRWSFGTFQCMWKHRQAFWRGTLGWVAMPNMVLFQTIFPLLCPLGDLAFLLALLWGNYSVALIWYVGSLLVDLFGSVIAFRLDQKPLSRLWVVLVQRFYYRQFMYCVTYRAVLAAIKGRQYGWNKLERKGSVMRPELAPAQALAA